jgi:hypothetical protein
MSKAGRVFGGVVALGICLKINSLSGSGFLGETALLLRPGDKLQVVVRNGDNSESLDDMEHQNT